MPDSYSPNKSLGLQVTGSNNNTWGTDLNSTLTTIDTALGGVTQIVVTGVAAGIYTLTAAQYTPPNIEFTGTLGGHLTYVVPSPVGGFWSVWNHTSGAFELTFASGAGSAYNVPAGTRVFLICDGTYMQLASNVAGASANPSALVGLTAVNGTASTFMTSDSAPVLDQSISPTMTGTWAFNGPVTLSGAVALDGNMTVNTGTIINAGSANVLVATQVTGDNSTHPATTAFVQAQLLASLLASPALGGTPTTPTAAAGTNNTQIATTAFAQGPAKNLASNGYIEFPSGLILQWGINTFSSTGSSITFSAVGGIAFPHNAFMAIANTYGSAATSFVQSVSTTTLTAVNGISSTCSWIAIGN
jgi:hypothetical protein